MDTSKQWTHVTHYDKRMKEYSVNKTTEVADVSRDRRKVRRGQKDLLRQIYVKMIVLLRIIKISVIFFLTSGISVGQDYRR